jgi:hypothetical protein
MKLDRKGQVWQIASDLRDDLTILRHDRDVEWKTFTIVSTTQERYETISGESRAYVKHKVIVSESGIVVELNEDLSIPWEDCANEYRRIV